MHNFYHSNIEAKPLDIKLLESEAVRDDYLKTVLFACEKMLYFSPIVMFGVKDPGLLEKVEKYYPPLCPTRDCLY